MGALKEALAARAAPAPPGLRSYHLSAGNGLELLDRSLTPHFILCSVQACWHVRLCFSDGWLNWGSILFSYKSSGCFLRTQTSPCRRGGAGRPYLSQASPQFLMIRPVWGPLPLGVWIHVYFFLGFILLCDSPCTTISNLQNKPGWCVVLPFPQDRVGN